jgi:hypothetical protein
MRYILLVMIVLIITALPSEAADYIVRHGDTLSKIARKQLGDAKRWSEIAKLNKLKHPYTIRVGQHLVLPDAQTEPKTLREPAPTTVVPLKEVAELPEIPQAPPEETPAIFEIPVKIWLWLLIGLLTYWWFSSFCIYGGCWFSLVETTFSRCMLLSLVLAVLFEIILLIDMGISILLIEQKISEHFFIIPVIMSCAAFPFISLVLIKKTLNCKWRSVLTTMVMTQIVALLCVTGLYAGLFLILPRVMGTQAVKEFINALMNSI